MNPENKNPKPKDDISTEAYFEIRQKLPGYFQEFSSEFLTQMIFDFDRGFPPRALASLTPDAQKQFDESPRGFMIAILKKERDGAVRCLELLGAKD